MSKYQFHQSDIYQPGTELPKNRLNIVDAELLHAVESHLLTQAYDTFVAELQPGTQFDEAYFIALHRRTFETLYDWGRALPNGRHGQGWLHVLPCGLPAR